MLNLFKDSNLYELQWIKDWVSMWEMQLVVQVISATAICETPLIQTSNVNMIMFFRKFAENIGLAFFTPEDFFNNESQTPPSKNEEAAHFLNEDSVTSKKRPREEKQHSDEEHQSDKTLH